MDISDILGNIYERPIAIVFETVFFSSFWRLWKLVFCQKILQNLLFTISFYPENGGTCSRKDSMTQTWLVVESCPAPRWVTFLLFCRLIYKIPYHFKGLLLAWSTSLQLCKKVSHPNSRLEYEIFPFLKQALSVIDFLDMMIEIELLLWNWKER